jgi:hypothetical protein
MKIKEYSFADLISLREHATSQLWKEFDRERARSTPSKAFDKKMGEWKYLEKLAARELHDRVRALLDES